MATKKKATKRKSKSKELMDMSAWEKKLAEEASKQSSKESASLGDNISIQGGKFTFQGANLGTSMNVVVLDFSHVRTYYDGDFDPNNPIPPACFAISEDGEDEAPHEDSPNPQCDTNCVDCDWDAWGSAEKGNGKACRQKRRLAVLSYEEDLSQSVSAILTIPSASLKNWKGYLKQIENKFHKPCFGVATRIFFDEEATTQGVLDFDLVEPISNAADLQTIYERREEMQADLMSSFDVSNYEEPDKRKPSKKRKSVKKTAKKKTVGKKRSKFSS